MKILNLNFFDGKMKPVVATYNKICSFLSKDYTTDVFDCSIAGISIRLDKKIVEDILYSEKEKILNKMMDYNINEEI